LITIFQYRQRSADSVRKIQERIIQLSAIQCIRNIQIPLNQIVSDVIDTVKTVLTEFFLLWEFAQRNAIKYQISSFSPHSVHSINFFNL
jgi:hypothetical protein